MAALLAAARLGVPVQGCTLYTTTFPCHNCTRHLISAGIDRVVYVEPYPKSRAADLHSDSVIIDPSVAVEDKVRFEPFVGVSPRRYMELFTFGRRQRTAPEGRPVHWNNDKRRAQPNFTRHAKYFKFYIFREMEELGKSKAISQINTQAATKPAKKASKRHVNEQQKGKN
jgi:cytidine deaminase